MPNRVIERSYLLDGLGHLLDASRIQSQTVQESIARASRTGFFEIAPVGGDQASRACAKGSRHLAQPGVFGFAIARCYLTCRDSGASANRDNLGYHGVTGSMAASVSPSPLVFEDLSVSLAVRIETLLFASFPRSAELGSADVPVGPALA